MSFKLRPHIVLILIICGGLSHAALAQQAVRTSRPDVTLPAESEGWDAVLNGLVAVFDDADVLMLGEAHGRKVDSELRLRLIRHPGFLARVRYIIVEFASEPLQPVLDRYVRGDAVSASDTEALQVVPAMFRELFGVIREANQSLPASRRVRVLAGDPPPGTRDRNARPIALLRDEVLKARQKALVIYGSGHVWRHEGGITSALQDIIPDRVFVAETLAPVAVGQTGPQFDALDQALQMLEATLQSRERPVLVLLKNKPAAASLVANPFYLGQAMLRDNVTIGDNDDAIVYFGRSPEAGAFVR